MLSALHLVLSGKLEHLRILRLAAEKASHLYFTRFSLSKVFLDMGKIISAFSNMDFYSKAHLYLQESLLMCQKKNSKLISKLICNDQCVRCNACQLSFCDSVTTEVEKCRHRKLQSHITIPLSQQSISNFTSPSQVIYYWT